MIYGRIIRGRATISNWNHCFSEQEITLKEVRQALKRLFNNQSPGTINTSIHSDILKLIENDKLETS